MKYTGRMPSPISGQRPSTPESKFPGLSIRSRTHGSRSPLTSPARFISQRGGVEALFQGAAKNVIERGEKLGINQAVRDAMGEIRRNMQELRVSNTSSNNSRITTPITSRHDIFTNGLLRTPGSGEERKTASALERRNKQLAMLLDEAINELKAVAASDLEGADKDRNLEAVEMAAAKVQFVKIYLEDSSLDLAVDSPVRHADPPAAPQVVIEDDLPPVAVPEPASAPGGNVNSETSSSLMIAEDEIMTDSEGPADGAATPKQLSSPVRNTAATMEGVEASPLSPSSRPPDSISPHATRPAPIPTRSTLAQSSFSWMLEPDEKTPLPPSSSLSSSAGLAAAAAHHRSNSTKRPSNAFLFGEVVADDAGVVATGAGGKPFTSEDIFGLEPLRRPSKARGKYDDLFGGALGES